MKHKALGLAAIAVAATLGLAACSSPGNSSGATADKGKATGTVTMWMYPVIKDPTASKKFWDDASASFEKSHPGVTLDIQMQTFDKRDEQISAALAAHSGPDIVLITPDQASAYEAIGGLLPVDDALAKSRKDFYPGSLKAATIDGDTYGVPIFQNVATTAYNKSVFDKAGLDLPTTWTELTHDAPILAKDGVAVMDYQGTPEQTLNLSFYPFLWQAGGTVFTKDGKDVAFDSAAGVKALTFLVNLQKEGGLPADAATEGVAIEGSQFAAGKVGTRAQAMLPDVAQMRTALGADNVVLGAPLKGKVQATYGNPGLLALTSINKSENRQAAYEALSYLSSASFQKSLNKAAGNFPTRSDVPLQITGPDKAAIEASLKVANPGEANPASRQVMAALAPYIQSALRGDLSPKAALDKAAAEAKNSLNQ